MNRLGIWLVRVRQELAGLRHWKLSTKLTVVTALIALVPLAFIIYWSYTTQQADLLAQQNRTLQSVAKRTADAIDNRIVMRQHQLVAVASSTVFSRLADDPSTSNTQTSDDVGRSLSNLARTEPAIESAFLASTRGDVLATSGVPLNATFADRPFFKAAASGNPAASDFELASNGRRYVYYATPIRNRLDEVTAVLALRVQAADVEELIDGDRGALGPDSYGVLWDRQGKRLRGGQNSLPDQADGDLARLVGSGDVTERLARPDGALLLATQAPKSLSVIYSVVQPEANVLATLQSSSRVSWLVFLLALLTVLAASFGMARLIARPLKELQRAAGAIRRGDYTARAQIRTRDEIGEVATSMNQMLDDVTVLVQTRADRDRIQQQIMTLLSEVSTAAAGDLTIEAQVTDGELGSVADAFNYMVGELRTIIANVNATTVQVSSSTGEILAASHQLVSSAGEQAHQIALTSKAVDDMSESIARVSDNSRTSAQVAYEAREYARQGLDSVRATMQGMQRIRGQVQQTAKQIKRLGESSQEIGQIVQLISEMAEKTDLLALNAAIQAAMAGEHGRGFAVVADEVRRLAERAASATKQISMLVQSIQADTAQAVIAMESNTHEVVEGSRLADAAGQSLETIDAVVRRLAELIDAISQAAEQQAGVSRGIARSMADISEVTQTTSVGSRQTAESVGYLARLAEQLRLSVATFKLNKSEA